jgi:hypothetical protein
MHGMQDACIIAVSNCRYMQFTAALSRCCASCDSPLDDQGEDDPQLFTDFPAGLCVCGRYFARAVVSCIWGR